MVPHTASEMGTPSIHALPEHWTELNAARRQRRLCAEQVEAIKGSCKDEFGTDDVAEHPQYYGKLLDRIRARYNDSEEREWFAQRRAFLHELDGLFQDAKEGKRTLSSIEARIESEKEAWYRWVLRRYPEFIAVSDRGANQEEIRGMLDDPDRSREELVRTMMEAIGQPADSHVHVVSFAEKVDAVKDDADELKKLYIAEFFTNHESGTPLRNSERYLEEYRNSNTMTLEDVIDRIMQDFQRSRNSQPQREEHKRRLDELRRAKTAFEQNRMQAKGLKEAQALGAGPELYEVQPCLVCGTRVSLSDVFSCAVCQAMVQLGGEARLALYCSEQCFSKGHVSFFFSGNVEWRSGFRADWGETGRPRGHDTRL